ncbi:MAG: hypothetical protein AB7L66_15325 [Gemmatimonadales bacterium]
MSRSLLRVRSLLAVVGGALLAGCPCYEEACTDPVGPTGVVSVRIDQGDGQVGPEFARLPLDLTVKTVDGGDGSPVRGVTARFAIESGGGQLSKTSAVTDADGLASAGLTLGGAGEHRVKVTFVVGGRDLPNFLRFVVTAHGAPNAVISAGGDGQSGEAGSELPNRVAVKIVDAQGIGVPDIRAWFIPEDGGGPDAGEVVTSSIHGVAQMPSRWRLGPAVGTQHLRVRVLSGPTGSLNLPVAGNPFVFTATVTAAVARSVTRNPAGAPDPQAGIVGDPVAQRPSVKVSDGGGNPLAGVAVRFEVAPGSGHMGGSLIITERQTDADGIVTVPDWIPGSIGTNTLTATVLAAGVAGNPVVFHTSAVLPAVNLLVNGSFESDVTDRTLPTGPGHWGGDFVTRVPRPAGFPPIDGSSVLQFIATGSTAASTNTLASEVFQLVDLSRFAVDIDAGRIRIDGEALFGRVDAPDVDRLFGLQLLAFTESPAEFPARFAAQGWAGRVRVDQVTDVALVWGRSAGSLLLPPGTRFVAIHLFAFEDVVNDGAGTPEFAGHFADAAALRVAAAPVP